MTRTVPPARRGEWSRCPRFEPELYGASAGTLASRLSDVDDAVGTVLLIGHNPAIQLLALDLARSTRELRVVEAK